MKILFVKPYWKWGKIKFGSPPLGLMLLSAIVKKQLPGCTTDLIDFRLEDRPHSTYETRLRSWQPDIIAIMGLAGDESEIERIARTGKALLPGTHITCGGALPTISPESFFDLTMIDSIIAGEGEVVFVELVKFLADANRNTPPTINGLSVRQGNGLLERPVKSDPIEDLDALPFPDWDLIDIDRYAGIVQMNGVLAGKRYMPVFTSRGCPYQCIFCHNLFGKKTRFRSAENVVKEIEILVTRYRVDEIQIFDDIFNLDRQRVIDICNMIREKGLSIHISFPNGLRGDRLDDELIQYLKKTGTYMITFAIESASPDIQRLINKNLELDKVEKAIDTANRHGIITKSFFMVGFPWETRREILSTLNFAVRSRLTTLVIFVVTPFKGTRLYDIAGEFASPKAKPLLENPLSTYFSSRSYYTATTGIHLKPLILLTYFRFFTPVRLFRFFQKIPRKKLYLSHLKSVLSVLFIHKRFK